MPTTDRSCRRRDQDLIADFRKGLTHAELSRRYGIGRTQVCNILRRARDAGLIERREPFGNRAKS